MTDKTEQLNTFHLLDFWFVSGYVMSGRRIKSRLSIGQQRHFRFVMPDMSLLETKLLFYLLLNAFCFLSHCTFIRAAPSRTSDLKVRRSRFKSQRGPFSMVIACSFLHVWLLSSSKNMLHRLIGV